MKIENKFINRCDNLALICQKLWKGYKVRKCFELVLMARKIIDIAVSRSWITIMRNVRKKSAITIQRHVRGFLCRKNLQDSMQDTFQYKAVIQSLILIQKHIRSFIIKSKYTKMQRSVIYIQHFWRGYLHKISYKKTISQIIKIQRKIRSYLIKIKQIKLRLIKFLAKEQSQAENIKFIEAKNLQSRKPLIQQKISSQDLAKSINLSQMSIDKKDLNSGPSLNGSFSRFMLSNTPSPLSRARKTSPFRLEKMHFFTRVLEVNTYIDTSIVYEPLWTSQYMNFVKACNENKEYVMDVRSGMCHTAGLTSKGNVYVWGWNDKNQCGSKSKIPHLFEGLGGIKALQISCGDEHTLIKSSQGEVWCFGDNSKGQLGQGHYKQINGCCKVQIPTAKQVCSVGIQNIVISEDGSTHIWPYEGNDGAKQSFPVRILESIIVDEVSAGFNFAIFLNLSGLLYSFGCNTEGQLGLGDILYRSQPTLISSLKNKGEKIIDICCGFDHAIARSTLGKAFTWGAGHKGQLGHYDNTYESFPIAIVLKTKLKCIQIAAGWGMSFIMLENRKIYSSGGKTNYFTEANASELFAEFSNTEEYGIVKISSAWSRMFSLTLGTFADVRSLQTPLVKLQNQLNFIASRWEKNTCVVDYRK